MHLYTLVAAPFVMQLLDAASTADAAVKEKSSWIQAAFLIGWALGGGQEITGSSFGFSAFFGAGAFPPSGDSAFFGGLPPSGALGFLALPS